MYDKSIILSLPIYICVYKGTHGLGEAAHGVFAGVGHEQGCLAVAAGEDEDAYALFAEFSKVFGCQGEVAFDADAVDDVEWHGGAAFAVFVEDDGVAVDAQAEVFAVDDEGAHVRLPVGAHG